MTSISARIQLFKIPLEQRKNYQLNTNERWLDIVRAAVANKSRHDEKNKSCQRTITTYLPVQDNKRSSESSSTAKPYVPRKYVQGTLDNFCTYSVHNPTYLPVQNKKRFSESSSIATPYVPRKYVQGGSDNSHVIPVHKIV